MSNFASFNINGVDASLNATGVTLTAIDGLDAENVQSGIEELNSKKYILCTTMLNGDGVEYYNYTDWDKYKSPFLNISTGQYNYYPGVEGYFYVTPYILCYGLSTIQFKGCVPNNTALYVQYDRFKNILYFESYNGSFGTDIEQTVTIIDDCFYIRFCGLIAKNNIGRTLEVSTINSTYKEATRKIQEYLTTSLYNPVIDINIDTNNTILYNPANINPISVIKETSGLTSIFHEWAFIGDSLSSGANYDPYGSASSNIFTIYEYSWCQQFINILGNANGANYSQPGWTTSSWIDIVWNNEYAANYVTSGETEYFKVNKKQAYCICLGTNDLNNSIDVGDTSTNIDFDDFTNNASTFAGNYAGIIQRIKTIQPSAKIFIMTLPTYFHANAETIGYNTVIRNMSTLFSNVFVLDLYNYSPNISSIYNYNGHLDTVGYQWFAYMIVTYIDYIIRNDELAFRYVSIIGTEHDNGDL